MTCVVIFLQFKIVSNFSFPPSLSPFFPFFSSFLAALRHMEFPGQGSDPSCSCDLRCRCSSASVLGQGSNLRPRAPEMPLFPLHHSRNSSNFSSLRRRLFTGTLFRFWILEEFPKIIVSYNFIVVRKNTVHGFYWDSWSRIMVHLGKCFMCTWRKYVYCCWVECYINVKLVNNVQVFCIFAD